MKEVYQKKGRISTLFLVGLLLLCLFLLFPFSNEKEGGRYAARAEVASGDLIEIKSYDVRMNVLASRKVEVEERITVRFLADRAYGKKLTMFYRSLPTDGARYSDITASCAGNEAFSYEVVDNPDMDGFIDVECVGGVKKDAIWTYSLAYDMTPTEGKGNQMIIDVIGFGWSVDLHNVTGKVTLPAPATSCKVYEGGYGGGETQAYHLSADKRTVTFSRDVLKKVYNDTYYENMAAGVTLQFEVEKGVLKNYTFATLFTKDTGILLLIAACLVGLALLLYLTRGTREIVTAVHVKPPKGMSPLLMGKIIDGNVDDEDITSMLYYFAHKGYLRIDLTDEEDPTLIRLVPSLPPECPAHEHTLFNGLFDKNGADGGRVKISQLAQRYYGAAESAKAQVLSPKPMYTTPSAWRFAAGWIIGALFAFFAPFLVARRLGGGYAYIWGVVLLIPLAVNLVLALLRENYRYKWKGRKRLLMLAAQIVLSGVTALAFICLFASFIMTAWEKLFICVGALLPSLLTGATLLRSEKYAKTMEDVLGFKEFILVTEEDRIKFMLEENPQLYYEVLPYAQVLGVTEEWTKKFAAITLPPPEWCSGNYTVFDYLFLHHCMRRSLMRSMAQAAMKSRGGGHIGRSGGGGGFGGFGGGGFGGGGGGAR